MALRYGFTITGMDEVLRKLEQYGERAKQAAASALYEEARAIEETSVAQYVPVDTGQLRRDMAFVEESAKIQGDNISVEFGYRGPYAAAVHENPRAGRTGGVSPSGRKYKHWATVGQYKFLETPMLAAQSGMLARIADKMRSILGGG